MIKATFIRKLEGWRSDARLYELSDTIPARIVGGDVSTKFVVVSAVNAMFSGNEVLIFPAREDGTTIDMLEIAGIRGSLDHEEAIREAGWEVAA